jgi:Skp family chaperone for outer membrane proteins
MKVDLDAVFKLLSVEQLVRDHPNLKVIHEDVVAELNDHVEKLEEAKKKEEEASAKAAPKTEPPKSQPEAKPTETKPTSFPSKA